MGLPRHFMVSEADGCLYDTRKKAWYEKPLRKGYRRTYCYIGNIKELKATLRAGPYTWPGGYPMFFITSDGGCLHFGCVRENLRDVFESIQDRSNDGWRVVGTEINYEDRDLICDHCGDEIESAYGDDENGENDPKNNLYDDDYYGDD